MLSITNMLPVQLNDRTLSQFEKVDLSHLLAHLFITEVYKALKRGIFRGYFSKSENINHLKGRLLVSQHIRKNAFASVKAFCEYDELTTNVPLNQLLKAALKIIHPFVKHSTLKTQTLMIFEMFDEVDDVYINTLTMEKIQMNRQNQHYEGVLQLAIAIINSTAMSTGSNKQIAFSFLFKMNDLYEGYVGECLKRVLAATPFKLDLQHKEKRLLIDSYTNKGTVQLKPDFVVSRLEEHMQVPMIILDTKWKNIFFHSKQSDIYQMYAYITAYKTAERCIILYPQIGEESAQPKWRVPDSLPVKHIEVQTIRLDQTQHTIEDLGELLTIL
jgi:5-methylcytosine-specific restriction enzyme subunit McrC